MTTGAGASQGLADGRPEAGSSRRVPRALGRGAAGDLVRRGAAIWLGGGEAEVLTDWHGEICDAWPLADGRLVAVVATDEPTEEEKRMRAERDDAIVWGEHLRRGRLRLLDLATAEFRTVDGLGSRHVVELAPRPEGVRWRLSAGRVRRRIRRLPPASCM